jgi:hypothetical protein
MMNHSGTMKYTVRWGAAWCVAVGLIATALAQDIPGIEICTRESRMDRRTGCLQSNVDFLQQVVTKNGIDTQQKLSAANREIVALREQVAAASREAVTLKGALAALEARIATLEKAPMAQPKPDVKK